MFWRKSEFLPMYGTYLNQLPSRGNAFGPGISLVGRAYCNSLFTSFVSLCSIGSADTTDFARHCTFGGKREPLISWIRNLTRIILYWMPSDLVVLQKYPQLCIRRKFVLILPNDLARLSIWHAVTFCDYLRQIYGSYVYAVNIWLEILV